MRRSPAKLASAAVALAADPASSTASLDQLVSEMMKERSDMVVKVRVIDTNLAAAEKSASTMEGDRAKALDAQLVALQKEVRDLQTQLANTPRYIPNAHLNKNRP